MEELLRQEDGRRKLLVVENDEENWKLLCEILGRDYEMLRAEDGEEALHLMEQCKEQVSLVLLDIMMPVLDGFGFLQAVKKDPALSSIPVVVTTRKGSVEEEIRCLSAGASDFLTKPYNSELVKHRVAGIIRLRESFSIVNMLKYDQLTGVCSKEYFYQYVSRSLEAHPEKKFDIICCDVENFKLINERYGVKGGDSLLRYLASKYQETMKEDEICTRLGADTFAMMKRHMSEDALEEFSKRVAQGFKDCPVPNLTVKYGIYQDVDCSLPIPSVCDRAKTALRKIKRQYGKYTAVYDESIHVLEMKEQWILDNMERALKERQFHVYYQPKYDMHTGFMSGAEALVRWIHPELGFMSPGEFIPVFEKNGFIPKLDFYVWEEVCRTLGRWKEEGIPVVPVSVNISRADFNEPCLSERIEGLVDQYGIAHELLHLEVTESAYTEDPQHILDIVSNLRAKGFKIEMDDFGSGYSSLNMLSELSVDILKVDMRFMQRKKSAQKKSILSFIISLGKWLELYTIAEGVETREQVDALRNMGCDCVQGFYYAKPMPEEDFREYLRTKNTCRKERKPGASAQSVVAKALPDELKHTILIAEDNEVNREILTEMLSPWYHILETRDGSEAYQALERQGKDISAILLDLMMPVMDGFQFLHRIKGDQAYCGIPVIITSETSPESEMRAIRLGAESFVPKPYQQEILLHHVRRAIELSEFRRLRLKGQAM